MRPCITVISTEHKESGKCNSDELCAIIEAIEPEVIFEEQANDDVFRRYYEYQPGYLPLEVRSIRKYLQERTVKHIPVDIQPNQYLGFSEWDFLFDTFRRYDVYRRIEKRHCTLRDLNGFEYLNSKECLELFSEMKAMESQIIGFSGINRDLLLRTYDLFHREHDERENAMLLNICNYSRDNSYRDGVFLLGYAHRMSVMKKVWSESIREELELDWKFYGEPAR